MSGIYGHETRNIETSKIIYAQSWSTIIQRHPLAPATTSTSLPDASVMGDRSVAPVLLADGYSCRSQVERLAGRMLAYPVQALLDVLRTRAAQSGGSTEQAAAMHASALVKPMEA